MSQVHRTPKLINKISKYFKKSDLRSTLEYMWALLTSWVLAFADKIPSDRGRRAVTRFITLAVIIIIIACGILIVYLLVVVPTPTTRTTYP